MSSRSDPTPTARAARTDGEQSRERLLQAALRLFAQQGYAKASTREIADAAGANLASIRYYFGDKAGLYRAVFIAAAESPDDEIARFGGEHLSLPEALRGLYFGFVEPLRQGEFAELCMKLYMREMIEPTGMWAREIEEGIRPKHEALMKVLCRHLGLRRPDHDVARLATSLVGLGLHLHVCADVLQAVAPALNRDAKAYDLWLDRLVMYGCALVQAERERREGGAGRGTKNTKNTKKDRAR